MESRVVKNFIEKLHQMHTRTLHQAQEPRLLRIEFRGLQQLTCAQDPAQRGLELMTQVGQKKSVDLFLRAGNWLTRRT